MIDQQAESAQRTELTRQQKHEQIEQARQSKQQVVVSDEKKLIKKQSSKSKKAVNSKTTARSHDEIYNVQIIVVLQHQHNVDDVKCIDLSANYENCDEVFFFTSY